MKTIASRRKEYSPARNIKILLRKVMEETLAKYSNQQTLNQASGIHIIFPPLRNQQEITLKLQTTGLKRTISVFILETRLFLYFSYLKLVYRASIISFFPFEVWLFSLLVFLFLPEIY